MGDDGGKARSARDGALSDIIGTILLLGITVLLVGVAALAYTSAGEAARGSETPRLDVVASYTVGNPGTVFVGHTGGRSFDKADLEFVISVNDKIEPGKIGFRGPGTAGSWPDPLESSWSLGERGRFTLDGPLVIGDRVDIAVVSKGMGRTLATASLQVTDPLGHGSGASTVVLEQACLALESCPTTLKLFQGAVFPIVAKVDHPEGRKGILAVHADLSEIKGPPIALLSDDGTRGDRVAGDKVYTGFFVLAVDADPGKRTISVVATGVDGVPSAPKLLDLEVMQFEMTPGQPPIILDGDDEGVPGTYIDVIGCYFNGIVKFQFDGHGDPPHGVHEFNMFGPYPHGEEECPKPPPTCPEPDPEDPEADECEEDDTPPPKQQRMEVYLPVGLGERRYSITGHSIWGAGDPWDGVSITHPPPEIECISIKLPEEGLACASPAAAPQGRLVTILGKNLHLVRNIELGPVRVDPLHPAGLDETDDPYVQFTVPFGFPEGTYTVKVTTLHGKSATTTLEVLPVEWEEVSVWQNPNIVRVAHLTISIEDGNSDRVNTWLKVEVIKDPDFDSELPESQRIYAFLKSARVQYVPYKPGLTKDIALTKVCQITNIPGPVPLAGNDPAQNGPGVWFFKLEGSPNEKIGGYDRDRYGFHYFYQVEWELWRIVTKGGKREWQLAEVDGGTTSLMDIDSSTPSKFFELKKGDPSKFLQHEGWPATEAELKTKNC